MGVVDELRLAREAYDSRDWSAAFVRFTSAGADVAPDAGLGLNPEDLARCGMAAYLLGRGDDADRLLQRAHAAYLQAGETALAARTAFWIALSHFLRGEEAVAAGWLARGDRLVADLPAMSAEHGYLLFLRVPMAVQAGHVDEAERLSRQIEEIGRASGNTEVVAYGLHGQGRGRVARGDAATGLPLLDEAMATLMSGPSTVLIAGVIYCSVIEACQDVRDFRRASQWTRVLSTWCETQPDLVPFVGQCALHRGQLMRLAGAYEEAIAELDQAIIRYAAARSGAAAGLAHYERGEIHRTMGRWDEAVAAFEDAAAAGCDPHPGLALVWLAQGRHDAAHSVASRLADEGGTAGSRTVALSAVVEIAVAVEDVDLARTALERLEPVGAAVGTAAALASVARSRALVDRLEGDLPAALTRLREAERLWSELEAPIEAAAVRVELADVLHQLGDESTASVERAAAEAVLRGAGAHVAEPVHADAQPAPGGLTPREVEVLRLVARGLSNPAIAGELVLSEKTVARHLSNIFGKLRVGSRTAAAAFAFEHDLV